MVNGLVAEDEGRHFHGETSRSENQAAAGQVAAKLTRKKHVLRSKLTERMAVESPETSTTTTPIVETEQLETDVSCFSPPACPEYQTTLMASKTSWSGNQSHIWKQAHDPCWRLQHNARHDRHAFATKKPVVKSARRRLRTKGLDPARTPGGAATNPGISRMKHSQQPWCNGQTTRTSTPDQSRSGRRLPKPAVAVFANRDDDARNVAEHPKPSHMGLTKSTFTGLTLPNSLTRT